MRILAKKNKSIGQSRLYDKNLVDFIISKEI